VQLYDIVISETRIGDFRSGTIEIELEQPFGWSQMLFGMTGTLLQTQRHVTVTGGGNTTVTAVLDPITTLTGFESNSLVLNITRAGTIGPNTTPATITLSGISVVSDRADVPAGIYGLHVRGDLITNIESHILNALPALGGVPQQILPGRTNFRPWGQGSLLVPGLISVGGIGVAVQVVASVNWAGGGFTVDGESVVFRNAQGVALTAMNINDRMYVPMRAIIEGLGGTIVFRDADANGPAQIRTILPGAPNEVVTWTNGSRVVDITGGGDVWLTDAPMIWEGPLNPENVWSTFVPFRGIAEAHGLELEPGTEERGELCSPA
jgi:hypothetical protein